MRTELRRFRHLLSLLLLVFAFAGAAPAQESAAAVPQGAAAAAEAPQGESSHGDAGHGDSIQPTMEMSVSEFFDRQFGHMVSYRLFTPKVSPSAEINDLFSFYNTNKFQVFVLLVLALLFIPVVIHRNSSNPSRFVRIFRGWVHWIRDEMIYAILGKEEGRPFVPFFVFMFFFIAGMNALSLVPDFPIVGSYTATASIYVTGALAAVTFGMMLFFGMKKQGAVKFWVNLIPHGVPWPLYIVMVPVELIGLIVKPTALTLRLFANLLAGHLVLYSFIGLIFVFAQMFEMSAMSYVTAIPAVGLGVFVNTLEAFITLLQAYIFVYLSLIFVQQSMHPAH